MHRCLYVSEILRNICANVRRFGEVDDSTIELEGELFEARRTLYHLALTCRTMKDPALDILWGDLDSLYPLLCCLPGLHTRIDDILVSVPRLLPLGALSDNSKLDELFVRLIWTFSGSMRSECATSDTATTSTLCTKTWFKFCAVSHLSPVVHYSQISASCLGNVTTARCFPSSDTSFPRLLCRSDYRESCGMRPRCHS
jgi:hypothetical protein